MQVHQVELWSFNPMLLRLLGEISLSLLCSHSSRGSALDLAPPLRVGRLRASVLRSDRTGLKEPLLRGLWLTLAGGGSGTEEAGRACGVRGGVTLQQPEERRAFSQGSCPRFTGDWQWRLHWLPGGAVWRVTCARTQASWWRQQQP